MSKLDYENEMLRQGYKHIAGIDEVGRGCIAGPLVVAGVVMPLDKIIDGVDDSKKLSAKKRELLYDKIMSCALEYNVSVISQQVVDEINILNATKQGMMQCIENFTKADCVLIDAVKIDSRLPSLSIIHGDALSYSIACASIVAKVTRDRMMVEFSKSFPQYAFEKHKGYGTALHIQLLKQHGACELHRRTFIKNFI